MTIESTLERIAAALEKIASGINIDRVGGSVVASADPTPAAAEPEKRGRGRPRKEETAAAPAPEADPFDTTPSAASAFDEPEPPKKTYTADDVRAALVAYQKRATPEKARGLLKAVGEADTLKALKPELYAKVVEAAERAV